MMQCKVFEDFNYTDLQSKINSWLKENAKIEIITVSQSGRSYGTGDYTVLVILYKETN